MYYFIIIGCISLCLLALFMLWDSFKVNYEIQLFITNQKDEVLLVYDAKAGCFTIPTLKVAFDEIPTNVLRTYMLETYKNANWNFDLKFHKGNKKFDRIRDDYGPAYVYDENAQWRKKAILCYVLKVEEKSMEEDVFKQIPFPEFYNVEEIESMGVDIQPCPTMKTLIKKVLE